MESIFKKLYIKILFIIIILYSIAGFIALPYLIQSNFTNLIKKELNTNGYLNRVYINPFTFSIELHNLLIQDDKNDLLLYLESIKMDIEPLELLFGEITVDYIDIDSLNTSIKLYKKDQFNFSHILNQLKQEKTETTPQTKSVKKEPLPFSIHSLKLENTILEFTDFTKSNKFNIKTKPFNLTIDNFSTKENIKAIVKTNIEIVDTLNLKLDSRLIVNPLKTNGDISISKLQLSKIYSYLKDQLKFEFNGHIDNISTKYLIDLSQKQIAGNIKNFNLNIADFAYKDNKFKIDTFDLNSSIQNANIKLQKDLVFNISDIDLKNKKISFNDFAKKDSLNFNNLNIDVDKFSSDKSKISKISLSLETPQSGKIDINSKAIQQPLKIDSDILIKNLTVVPYKEYVKDFINIDIKETLIDIDSKAIIEKKKQQIEANINISKIDLLHNITKKNILKMDTINIEKLRYTNDNLFIEKVLLDKFYTTVKIDKKKNTNFDNLLISQNDTKKNDDKKKQEKRQSNFNYYIKKLKIANGKVDFSDHSLPLNFDTKIDKLNTTVDDLSSKNDEATILFNGVVQKYGMANIKAHTILSNFKTKTNVKIDFKNLDVVSFSPYSGKFIGQKISDGRLWLDLDYKIKNAQLQSTNNIKIKNLTLGEDVESKDALNLPVGLAIALLEDGDGLIDLDVPIKGDMDEPQFELSGVIWKALGNVITNIATAPFRFLGSLLGIDSDELGIITFNFADSTITPPQKEKLDQLIKIFQKKKNLVIVLEPLYNKPNDSKFLRDRKFNTLIKSDNKEKKIKELFISKFGEKQLSKFEKIEDKNVFIETLSQEIKKTIDISKEELDTLAKKRVTNIKEYFIAHKLTLDRIQLKEDIIINNDKNAKKLALKLELSIRD